MKIRHSPQRNDKQIHHKFNNDIIQITVDKASYVYDFSDLTDGQMTAPTDYIISAKRVNGELSVEIVNYIGADATEEEKFPQWQTIERTDVLEDNTHIMPIEWITQEELEAIEKAPKPLSEMEFLKEKIATQDQVIEELMFIIIPEITGGGI